MCTNEILKINTGLVSLSAIVNSLITSALTRSSFIANYTKSDEMKELEDRQQLC